MVLEAFVLKEVGYYHFVDLTLFESSTHSWFCVGEYTTVI